MSSPTYYDLLKVTPDAPSAVIRASWRALAFAHHPDRLGNGHDHADMAAINQAYEILIDPARRALYDLELQRAAVEALVRKAPRRSPPPAAAKPVPAAPAPAPASTAPSGQRGLIARVDVFWPMHLSAVPDKLIPGNTRLWAAAGVALLCALTAASWWVEHRDAERLHTMSLMQRAGAAREAGFMPNLDRDALLPVAQERRAGARLPGRGPRADAAVLTWTPALMPASTPASQIEPPKNTSTDVASSASTAPSGGESAVPSPAAMAEVQTLERGSHPLDGGPSAQQIDSPQSE
jgi:hypothetical protein